MVLSRQRRGIDARPHLRWKVLLDAVEGFNLMLDQVGHLPIGVVRRRVGFRHIDDAPVRSLPHGILTG
jgi:hypothetical protein